MNILIFQIASILVLNILPSEIALSNQANERILVKKIENLIEKGNLSQATQLLEKMTDSPLKKTIEANIAARVGDYQTAIALYQELIDELTGQARYRLIWNYIQILREKAELRAWQLSQEFDPQRQQDLKKAIQDDLDLATKLARNYRSNLEIAVVLWQLRAEEVDRTAVLENILALPDSGLKIELLIAIDDIEKAILVADSLKEPQFLSWAYGERGKKQLKEGRLTSAIADFETATLAANQIQDSLALARWQSYLGEVHQKLGNLSQARLNYEISMNAISKIRKEVMGYRVDPLLIKEVQSILRSYLTLLLSNPTQESDLKQVIEIQKLSTLSELDSYFKILCDINVNSASHTQIEDDTAYVYTFILNSRLHFIVQSAQGYFEKSVPIVKTNFEQQLYQWRLALSESLNDDYLDQSRQLYKVLIKPIEPAIQDKKRLIFVQDGLLRTVPMSALLDGNDFLIERYIIAYSLGFKLRKPNQRLKTALIAGSSLTKTEFLPSVTTEVAVLGQLLAADILTGNELNKRSLSQKLQNYSYDLVHLATRNQIMPNIEESIFSLGKQEISLLEFEKILRNRKGEIAFLNLASCDTASGNSVVILGLSGIGLRTGIINTVGSLWGIPDEQTTDFMIEFYKSLREMGSYERSLRSAQLDAINNNLRPHVWAAFINLTNE